MPFEPGRSGNPAGRPKKNIPGDVIQQVARVAERFDGWTNQLTALGTGRDKRTHSWFATDVVTDIEALNLWLGDDICKRVIEARPKTAWRRGFTLKIDDKEIAEKTKHDMQRIGLVEHMVRAGEYENAYGGAALYVVTEDSGDLSQPLDEDNIQTIKAFHLLEPRELWAAPGRWYTDISNPKFRTPEIYNLVPLYSGGGAVGMTMQSIHETRLIIFPGRRVSHQVSPYQRPGWGHSALTGIYQIIRDFGATWGYVAALMQDFAQGVLSMNGYAALMKEDGGEAIVRARIRMLDAFRSTIRMMVVDKEDTFSRQQTPMSGLSDLLHDFANRIAAAAEQPVTVLFGMAPAGLNATGDNDVRGWYDTVDSHREHHYKPRLERALELYFKSKDGCTGGELPEHWSTDFPPLWEPTEKEVAETRLAIAQADKIYAVDIQAISDTDVAESRWKAGEFSPDMTVDWTARDAQKKAEADLAKQMQDAELEKARNPTPPTPPNDGSGGPPPSGDAPPPADVPKTEMVAGRRVPVKARGTVRGG